MKKVLLKEIASIAGVVPSTVSCVLNGKAKERRISDDLAQKIKEIAAGVGYIPNQVAVSLRTGYSKILGLIVEDISNIFFATLAKVLEDEVQKHGYRVVYCSTENDKQKGKDLLNMLYHRQVDGYIIAPALGMEESIQSLLKQHKPVVLVDRFFPGLLTTNVLIDNYGSTRYAINYLLQKGYKRIAFVTTNTQMVQMQEREKAYRNRLEEENTGINEALILSLDYFDLYTKGKELITEFLLANETIDAIFFATNYLGMYGLQSLKALEWKIPERIAVVCFDDNDIFKLHSPGITCIRQPIHEIATAAAKRVIRQIEAEHAIDHEEILLQGELIIRGSA